MPKLTKQEMFDRAYRGLAGQKWRQSIRPGNDSCVYNGPNRTHCAFGWIDTKIPALYNSDTSIQMLHDAGVGVAAKLDAELLGFAAELQNAHDGADVPRDMRSAFKAIASEHGLKIPRLAK